MNKVIMSCDDNPYYLDFWPLVSKIWKDYVDITPVLIHVGHKEVSSEYGEVHTITPNEELPLHTQAQLARLWFPKEEPNVTWITSDIDMFPMSKNYWQEVINVSSSYDWTNLNSDGDYFPICYHVAKGNLFGEVLELNNSFSDYVSKILSEVEEASYHTLENWNGPELSKWDIDEIHSSKRIVSFRNSGGIVHQPIRPPHRRIDRLYWEYDVNLVCQGYYIDCHSLRPFEKFKTSIIELLNLL